MEIKISLNEKQFDELVGGKIVAIKTEEMGNFSVKIALQDIGYLRMVEIIASKIKLDTKSVSDEYNKYKP